MIYIPLFLIPIALLVSMFLLLKWDSGRPEE